MNKDRPGWHDWITIPTGGKKRQRKKNDEVEKRCKTSNDDSSGGLAWAKPIRDLPFRQQENSKCCFPAAVAVGICIFGEDIEHDGLCMCGRYILEEGQKREAAATYDRMQVVSNLIQSTLQDWGFTMENAASNAEVMLEAPSTPVIVRLRSKSEYPHCVVFYRNMILDPTEPHAILRSKKNLDNICGGPGSFLGITWAKRLVRRLGYQPWIMGDCAYNYTQEDPTTKQKSDLPTSNLLDATCEALAKYGLLHAAHRIRKESESSLVCIQQNPKQWLHRQLFQHIATISCCQYRINCTKIISGDANIGKYDIVVAEITKNPGQFISIIKGKVSSTKYHACELERIKEKLSWAIVITH
jgi:hypothetical protein